MAGWFKALRKTRNVFSAAIENVISGSRKIDEDKLEALEEALVRADLPPRLAAELIIELGKDLKAGSVSPMRTLKISLRERLLSQAGDAFDLSARPACVLLLGINGAGKTTTAAKLAHRAKGQGRKVLLGAADTFRAAGTEQLRLWGEKVGVPVVSGKQGADASSVLFDSMDAAHARDMDLVLIDTAGRMHTKTHLMDELRKMVRALKKRDESAPHAAWMVLDATMGQNALLQAKVFHEAVPLTGLVVTKLDGSSKAGFLFNVQRELPGIPVLFTGLGEGEDDLVPFDAKDFVDALFDSPAENPDAANAG